VVARRDAKQGNGTTAREVFVAVMRAADRMRRRATAIVEPHGITLQQYNVLRILDGAREDGVPTLEVAARMIEETPGVTRLLDRLEAKGYIRRQRCPRDRRQHLCWLSSDGARVLEKLTPLVTAAHERAMKRVAATDRQHLATLLDVVAADE
jgi:DNA-binding MarR family transcriptional regulator